MAIRIRVYPQHDSIGARRTRSLRNQQVAQHRMQVTLARQQLALERQRLAFQQQALGLGSGYGTAWRGAGMLGAYGLSDVPRPGHGSHLGFGSLAGYGSSLGSGYGHGYGSLGAYGSGLQHGYGSTAYLGGSAFAPYAGYGSSVSVSPWGTSLGNVVTQVGYGISGC